MKNISVITILLLVISSLFFTSKNVIIVAQSPEFKEANVYPLYLLKDKDITIEWEVEAKDGIAITYGDKTVIKGSVGKFIIPSEELSALPESFVVELKVNSANGEERKFQIETFTEPRELKLDARQFGMTERYQINFIDKEWDNDLVIKEIELDFPKSIYVRKNSFSPKYLEIYTKWEFYNDSRDVGGFLRWENQYTSQSDLPAGPKGLWTFRLWNSPRQPIDPDIQPSRFDPVILFIIGPKELL